jgi:hypothetical protein
MKTRDEIITECVGALRACYNYYADVALNEDTAERVRQMLDRTFPEDIATEDWAKLADDYHNRVENEE